jgi:putative hydrolase of the HAD superfamily
MEPHSTTLVIDWGDTLMRVFPQSTGPMSTWPEVEALPGTAQALAELKDSHKLVVATNAVDSHSRQVRQALTRAGLDHFFSAVFTTHELGARKPALAFFRALQSLLHQEPRELVMVGDSYRDDILGAQLAGWTTVWFNPSKKASTGLLPLQDLEVTRWQDLPSALASPRLPGYSTCLTWLQEQEIPYNLLDHVQGVAAAAYQLAVWLRAAGQTVDPLLAHRGGLLHDLAKLKAGDRRISHGELAGLMLKDRGYPQLAEIAHRHMLFSLIEPDTQPQTWEEKLVYFADKLIERGCLASLEERITGLRQRYPQDSQQINAILPVLQVLEEEICAAAGFPPSELIQRLKASFHSSG